MSRPESSALALELARACVRVHGERGVVYVGYRAPGSTQDHEHGLTYAHFHHGNSTDPRGDAERAADNLAALLAPLVDLGLRRADAARHPLPGTLDPRPVQRVLTTTPTRTDGDDGDPDD